MLLAELVNGLKNKLLKFYSVIGGISLGFINPQNISNIVHIYIERI